VTLNTASRYAHGNIIILVLPGICDLLLGDQLFGVRKRLIPVEEADAASYSTQEPNQLKRENPVHHDIRVIKALPLRGFGGVVE
jgi:hypothetical protein